MRAPGAVWGLFALESAMDELAVSLRIDPVELRLRNYAEARYQNDGGKPFTSKELEGVLPPGGPSGSAGTGATRLRVRCGGARR